MPANPDLWLADNYPTFVLIQPTTLPMIRTSLSNCFMNLVLYPALRLAGFRAIPSFCMKTLLTVASSSSRTTPISHFRWSSGT